MRKISAIFGLTSVGLTVVAALAAPAALAFENTKVLPKGVRNLNLRFFAKFGW